MEAEERDSVNARFPAPLKGRVLRAVHFRVHPKLDQLCDIIYERLADRFFEQETVFVDIRGQRYFGHIARVYPPRRLADLAQSRAAAAGHHPDALLPPNPWGNATAYGAVAHAIGIDLDIDADEADHLDRQEEYLYIVQLMDETGRFGGSTLECTGAQLSRDRQAFSKSILRRYLAETCEREGKANVPWQAKARLGLIYGLPTVLTHDIAMRNERLLAGHTVRRKATAIAPSPNVYVSPRTRSTVPAKREQPTDLEHHSEPPQKAPRKAAARFPMEDLDLDPYSIFDQRSLRRSVVSENAQPTLPAKPAFDTDVGIEGVDFELLLSVWSFLNNFGDSLLLSPLTLDDFISALQHESSDTPCSIIAEVHAVILNILIAEGLRMPGAASVSTIQPLPSIAAEREGFNDGMTALERRLFIRCGLLHARKWDRSARLKASKGRKGWQRYMLGALLQRGGLEMLPPLPRIIRHLFNGEHGLSDEGADEQSAAEEEAQGDEPNESDDAASDASEDEGSPADQYTTLPINDKLAILGFLCDLCMTCKKIRVYIDTTELFLTDLRKHGSQLNKAKRDLTARQVALDKAEGKVPIKKQSRQLLAPGDAASGPRSHSPNPSAGGDDKSVTDEDRSERSHSEIAESANDVGTPSAIDHLIADAKAEREANTPAKTSKKGKGKASPAKATRPPDTREGLDAELAAHEEQSREHDRELRRCKEVVRSGPLGQDRFFNAYIWLDGVGCQQLVNANGSHAYGTGRILVRAPEAAELDLLVSSRGGAAALQDRRIAEEGQDATRLEPGQWACITTEEQLDQLVTWLNPKGVRESRLKEALVKWRSYIVGGMTRRAKDLKDPWIKLAPALGDRRSARIAREGTPDSVPAVSEIRVIPRYLDWKNRLAVN